MDCSVVTRVLVDWSLVSVGWEFMGDVDGGMVLTVLTSCCDVKEKSKSVLNICKILL